MKRVKFTTALTPEDLLDTTLLIEKQELIKFALNYRALIRGMWRAVYRVDNFHGFLHEQKFWRSPKPIRIEGKTSEDLDAVRKEYVTQIFENYKRYR
jgi:hypothetical protein